MTAISALGAPATQLYAAAQPAGTVGASEHSAKASSQSDPAPKSVFTLEQDGVHISAAALVLQLREQGQSPLSIASSIGISIDEVNCYLGITVQQAQQQQAVDARIAHPAQV